MSTETGMVDKLALICARHMDVFLSGGEVVKFPAAPSTGEWADYSPREQAAARLLVHELFAVLRTPTPEMVRAGSIPGWDDVITVGLAEEVWKAMIDRALSHTQGEGE